MLGLVAEVDILKKKYGMSCISFEDSGVSARTQKMLSALIDVRKKSRVSRFSQLNTAPAPPESSAAVFEMETEESAEYKSLVQKATTSMKRLRKYQWVVEDSKRFEVMIRHLQDFNHSLYRLTQHSIPPKAVEGDILDATPDRYLEIVERATAESYPSVSFASNVRRSVAQLESSSPNTTLSSGPSRHRNLQIELRQLQFKTSPKSAQQNRALATYRPSHGRPRPALVEWRQFEAGLTGRTRDATIRRVDNLAQILQKRPKKEATEYFRVLECLGYYVSDQQVGYVFALPHGANPNQRPVSLEELLMDVDSDNYIDNPPLEKRLALCKSLCNCIYWLHAGDLVHKSIRSGNVLFFKSEEDQAIRLGEPYITGFDHSRPDGQNDSTITITAISSEDNRYRHPAATATGMSRRSTKIHDMYSLGLVLLEVAHWIKLRDLVLHKVGADVYNYLTSDESPIEEMDHLVGTRLQQVVYCCVRGDFEIDLNDPDSSVALREIFLHEIASEVMKCSV
jgi:hypothetical protein